MTTAAAPPPRADGELPFNPLVGRRTSQEIAANIGEPSSSSTATSCCTDASTARPSSRIAACIAACRCRAARSRGTTWSSATRLRYAPHGRAVRVPTQDQDSAAAAVRSFPLVEKPPFVWIWTGDPALADPALAPD